MIYSISPKKAKNKISKETHVLAQKIADKTAMTKDQANKLLEDFTDEILQISQESKREEQGTFQQSQQGE
jgi:nucleoid DNA-binding protein